MKQCKDCDFWKHYQEGSGICNGIDKSLSDIYPNDVEPMCPIGNAHYNLKKEKQQNKRNLFIAASMIGNVVAQFADESNAEEIVKFADAVDRASK